MEAEGRILILEDDTSLARALKRMLARRGYAIRIVSSLAEARRLLASDPPDVVLADIALPDGDGVAMAREAGGAVPFILMTGMPSVDSAVAALRAQAFDYLSKPFTEEVLLLTLGRALEVSRLRREVRALRTTLARGDDGLVGRSPALASVRERIRASARSGATVLITGETGVGKERVARALHEASGRTGRFVALNCGAVPEALFEAELFGSAKGSYTGSVTDRPGLVAEADGGTLFLDEIGDMPVSIQPKLLRLLQERTYRSLGRDREATADIRVVAATHRPLREMVRERRFREDLFWRLAVVEIALPPLRERREDIAGLTAHILAKLSARTGIEAPPALGAAALAALERHAWPGNVRELENVLERALLFRSGGRIEEGDLGMSMAESAGGLPGLDEVVERNQDQVVREYLVKVLKQSGNSVARAARLAGRNRTSFYRLLEKHGVGVEPQERTGEPS